MDYKTKLKTRLSAASDTTDNNSESDFMKSLRERVSKAQNPYLSVDNEYIESFGKKYEKFASDAQNAKINYSNAVSLYHENRETGNTLQKEADNIRSFYYAKRKDISKDNYKAMMEYLDSVDENLQSAEKYYKGNYDYYSQFDSEDDYNRRYAYPKKYENITTYDELNDYMNSGTYQLKRKNGYVSDEEDDWLRNTYAVHNRDIVDSMTYEQIKERQAEIEAEKDRVKDEIYDLEMEKAWGYTTNYDKDYEKKNNELANLNSSVLYYDNDGEAVTYDNLARVKKAENGIKAIKGDEEANALYETTIEKQKDLEYLNTVKDMAINLMHANNSEQVNGQAESDRKRIEQDAINYFTEKYGFDFDKGSWYLTQKADELGNELQNAIDANKNKLSQMGYDYDEFAYYEKWKADKASFKERQDDSKQFAIDHPIASTIFNIVTSPVQAFEYLGNVAYALRSGNDSAYGLANIYDDEITNFAQTSTSAISEKISNDVMSSTNRKLLAWLASGAYSGVSSSLQSAATTAACTALFGPAGSAISLGIMGGEAAGSAFQNAIRNGSTNGEAILTSLASGINEALFEKLSLENLKGIKNIVNSQSWNVSSLANLLKSTAKNSGKVIVQGLVEASEEGFTDVFNTIADQIINGDHSEYNTNVLKLINSGYSKEEAEELATQDWIEQILGSLYGGFVGGMTSGGVHLLANTVGGTVEAVNNDIKSNKYYNEQGNKILEGGNLNKLVTDANEIQGNKQLQRLAKEVAGLKIDSENQTKSDRKALAKKTGKLYYGVQTAQAEKLENTKKAAFQSAVRENLENAGVQNADQAAKAITKKQFGDSITKAEAKIVQSVNGDEIAKTVSESEDFQKSLRASFAENYKSYVNTSALPNISRADTQITGIKTSDIENRISEDGKTRVTSSGEEITVNRENPYAESKNGEVYLNTDRGTVALSDVSFGTESDALLYSGFADMNPVIASDIIKNYDGSIPVSAYVNGMRQGINVYGKYNFAGVGKDIPSYSFFADLSEPDQRYALKLGRSLADAETARKAKEMETKVKNVTERVKNRGKGVVSFEKGVVAKTEMQKKGVSLAKHLASALGIEIVFYDSKKDAAHANDNGWYDRADNSIHIDINAGGDYKGTIAYTLGHELAHFINEWSPAKFKAFSDFLIEQYGEHGKSVQEMLEAQMAKLGTKDVDIAMEELVADACETMLLDSNAVEKLTELRQKDATIFDKIKQFIENLLTKLREMYKKYEPDSTEAKELRKLTDVFGQIADKFSEAAVDATKAYNKAAETMEKADGDTKRSTRNKSDDQSVREATQKEITQKFQTDVDKVLNMQNTKSDNLIIGYTPDLMHKMGMPSLPFVIGTGHVYSTAKTEAEAKQDGNYRKGVHYHGLGDAVVKDIYAKLQDPVMIIAAKDVNRNANPMRSTHSVVAIVDVGKANKSLLLPVEITAERTVNGEQMDVNVLSSAYERNVENLIKEAVSLENSGDVGIYYAKKEATALSVAGVPFPIRLQATIASNPIIRNFDQKVNRNISDVTQSLQFKRWFGDWQNHPEDASKVVNTDGTPMIVYHGTNAQFNTFDLKTSGRNYGKISEGMFFFTNKKDKYPNSASDYAREAQRRSGGSAEIKECYLCIKKPLRVDSRGYYSTNEYYDTNYEKIYDQYFRGNYDGIIIENSDKSADTSVIYLVDNPTQIKSATDNIGTFDRNNPDIRYSKKGGNERYTYDALVNKPDMPVTKLNDTAPGNRADVLYIAKRNAAKVGKFNPKDGSVSVHVDDIDADVLLSTDGLRHGLRHTKDIRTNINAIVTLQAGEIIKNSIRINELIPSKQNAFGSFVLIGSARDGDGHLYIVRSVINQFELGSMDVLYAINAKKGESAALNAPRSTTTSLSVTDSNISIAELLDLVNRYFPDILPESVLKHYGYTERPTGDLGKSALYSKRNPDAIPNREILVNALETIAQNESEKNALNQYRESIGMLEELQDHLDEVKEEIKRMSFSRGTRDMKALRALKDEKIKTVNRINVYDGKLLRIEATKPIRDFIAREREALKKKYQQKGRELLRESTLKHTESINKKVARDRLQKMVSDTERWITSPSKTDIRCPDALKEPYMNFLASINLSSRKMLNGKGATQADMRNIGALDALANVVERIRNAQNPNRESTETFDAGYLDLPENYVNELRSYADAIHSLMNRESSEEHIVNRMTAEQIRGLVKSIRTLNKSIRDMSRAYANHRFDNIRELGDKTVREMSAFNDIKRINDIYDFLQWDNVTPLEAFKRFGESGESVFEELMDAQDKLAFLSKDIFDFKEKTWTSKEVRDWSKDTHTMELPSGASLTLTSADAMSIYCLSRREAALAETMDISHLTSGGVRVIGKEKNKSKTKDSIANLTSDDVKAICDSLSDRQKTVADAIQKYMSTVCAEWGNEITMKRFLTRDFTEQYYFPFESDDLNMTVKDPSAQQSDLFRLLNISAAKPLTRGANNRVIIRNVFDVFASHATDMAKLNSFGLALLDVMKWFNYTEKTVNDLGQITVRGVRNEMDRVFGGAAKKYVLNLIKDINGSEKGTEELSLPAKMLRNAKTAAVAGNLGVALLQLTALPRARLILSDSSIVLGLTKKPQIKKAEQYCGIALWKSFGFYDINISKNIETQIKGNQSLYDNIIEKAMIGAELGDKITWGYLWNACEYEIAKQGRYSVGSEQFNQEVAKKLREVVYSTQVVDSTLTKTQIMRNKSSLTKQITAFMSEPLLSVNLLISAYTQVKQKGWKAVGKYARRAISAYIISQIIPAVVEAFRDSVRDDDDEKSFLEKFLSNFWQNAVQDLLIVGKIPMFKDLESLLLSKFGMGYFDIDRMDQKWMMTISDAWDTWAKIINKGDESDYTIYNGIYQTANAFSQATGLPISNAMREVVTFWNNTAGLYNKNLKIRKKTADSNKRDKYIDFIETGNTSDAKSCYEEWIEYKKEEFAKKREKEEKIELSDSELTKKAKESIKQSVSGYFKDKVKEHRKDNEALGEIRKEMYSTGLFGSVDEVIATVNNWLKDYK